MEEKTDKKRIVRVIGKGIIIGIILFMIIFGIIAIAFLYLQENNRQIFGKGMAEPIIHSGEDNNGRDFIIEALNNVSREENVNLSNYITDIYIVDNISKIPCPNAIGCETPHKNIFGPLNTVIYIRGNEDGYYSDRCSTFESVAYHEIGHALYDLKFGIPDNQDDAYRKSLETYASSIAKKYAGFDKKTKKGCKEYYLAQEVETANKTLNAAREKLQMAKDILENAKLNLENIGRDVENAKLNLENIDRNVENAKANIANLENRVGDTRNKLSSVGFLDKLLNSAYYKNAVDEYNNAVSDYSNAINQYNAYVDSYNDAKNRHNAYVDSYNDAWNRYNIYVNSYNASLNEFNFDENNYFDKIRMEAIATSDEEMIDKGYT